MSSYEVGQIIYLIQPQKLAVVPVKVVEQIIKRTAEGEDIIYNVLPPNGPPLVALNSFDGQAFDNISAVKDYLLTNVQKSVDAMIEQTKETVETHFEVTVSEPVPKKRRGRGRPKKVAPDDSVQIDLGNGQVGNIKITEDLQKLV